MVVFALDIYRTFNNKIESTLQKIEVEKPGQNWDNVIFLKIVRVNTPLNGHFSLNSIKAQTGAPNVTLPIN